MKPFHSCMSLSSFLPFPMYCYIDDFEVTFPSEVHKRAVLKIELVSLLRLSSRRGGGLLSNRGEKRTQIVSGVSGIINMKSRNLGDYEYNCFNMLTIIQSYLILHSQETDLELGSRSAIIGGVGVWICLLTGGITQVLSAVDFFQRILDNRHAHITLQVCINFKFLY